MEHLSLEPEIGWCLASICGTNPVPLQDGSRNIEADTIIAVTGTHNAIWFGRVLSVENDDITVQYFHKCLPSNNQKYFLKPNEKEPVTKDSVVCSGVPMQPHIFNRMDNGTVTWKLVLPYSCYLNLSNSDHDMTNLPARTYSYCMLFDLSFGFI